jgi:hypothetical protein
MQYYNAQATCNTDQTMKQKEETRYKARRVMQLINIEYRALLSLPLLAAVIMVVMRQKLYTTLCTDHFCYAGVSRKCLSFCFDCANDLESIADIGKSIQATHHSMIL